MGTDTVQLSTYTHAKINRLYNMLVNKIAAALDTDFETADNIAQLVINKQLVLRKKYNKKIIKTARMYAIKISASKLVELEDAVKLLNNKFNLSVDDKIVCKVYVNNVLLTTLTAKKTNNFYIFRVDSDEARALLKLNIKTVFELADVKVQKMIRLFEQFNTLKNNLLQQATSSYSRNNNTESFDLSSILSRADKLSGVLLSKNIKHNSSAVVNNNNKTKQQKKTHKQSVQVRSDYYAELRREFSEYIDYITRKRLIENYNRTDIKTFEEFKKLVRENRFKNGEEKLIKDILIAYSHIRKFIEFVEKNKLVIDEDSIFKFFTELEKKQYSKNTLQRYKTHLKYFIKFLGDRRAYNFIKNLETGGVSAKNGQGEFYSAQEVAEMLKRIYELDKLTEQEREEIVALVALMYVTGLRFSEAARLKVKDIDLENRVGLVRKLYSKKYYARVFFFTEEVRDILVYIINKYSKNADDFLFDRKLRVFRDSNKTRITQILRRNNIDLKMSALRDSYATNFKYLKAVMMTDVFEKLENLTAGHSKEIVDRHYDQIKNRIEEIFDNRNKREEYKYIIAMRELYDSAMKSILRDTKLLSFFNLC